MQQPTTKPAPKFIVFMLTALACLSLAPAVRAQTAPQGWWQDQTKRAGILIAPCGDQLCGRIEWLKTPLDPQGKSKLDVHNPHAALRSQPICGLQILGGFVPDGSGAWTGGWIYDPDAGKTYKSEMHVGSDGTLHLRGYIGIPLLGRSEIWTRPPAALPQCRVP